MWVLKRLGDGKFVAKAGLSDSYTRNLKDAEKFSSEEEARANSCVENERPVNIDLYKHFA